MAVLTELDLPQYRQSLRKCVAFLNNIKYSPVKTKYNAKQWAVCEMYYLYLVESCIPLWILSAN